MGMYDRLRQRRNQVLARNLQQMKVQRVHLEGRANLAELKRKEQERIAKLQERIRGGKPKGNSGGFMQALGTLGQTVRKNTGRAQQMQRYDPDAGVNLFAPPRRKGKNRDPFGDML